MVIFLQKGNREKEMKKKKDRKLVKRADGCVVLEQSY